PSSFTRVILTVEEKYLDSSLVFAPFIQDEISSITSFACAVPVITNKHIRPTSFTLFTNLTTLAFTVIVYSNKCCLIKPLTCSKQSIETVACRIQNAFFLQKNVQSRNYS